MAKSHFVGHVVYFAHREPLLSCSTFLASYVMSGLWINQMWSCLKKLFVAHNQTHDVFISHHSSLLCNQQQCGTQHPKWRQPCEHQPCVARGFLQLPEFKESFYVYKSLHSTALSWIQHPNCTMPTMVSIGIELMTKCKWFKRSCKFDGNWLKPSQM